MLWGDLAGVFIWKIDVWVSECLRDSLFDYLYTIHTF